MGGTDATLPGDTSLPGDMTLPADTTPAKTIVSWEKKDGVLCGSSTTEDWTAMWGNNKTYSTVDECESNCNKSPACVAIAYCKLGLATNYKKNETHKDNTCLLCKDTTETTRSWSTVYVKTVTTVTEAPPTTP